MIGRELREDNYWNEIYDRKEIMEEINVKEMTWKGMMTGRRIAGGL